jgi:hypothetical protein
VHNTEYTHLPPLNSPPVFEIPWLCVFRPVVRAPLFSISNYNAIRAHSAPNNTVLANLLHLVSFFFIHFVRKQFKWHVSMRGQWRVSCSSRRVAPRRAYLSLFAAICASIWIKSEWRHAAVAGVIRLSVARHCSEGYCEFIFIWFYAAHHDSVCALALSILAVALHLWGMRNNCGSCVCVSSRVHCLFCRLQLIFNSSVRNVKTLARPPRDRHMNNLNLFGYGRFCYGFSIALVHLPTFGMLCMIFISVYF